MAVHQVGNGHFGILHFGERTSEIPHCRHRLLYKVDRSQAISHDYITTGLIVCMEGHQMPLWSSTYNHNRQWSAIH